MATERRCETQVTLRISLGVDAAIPTRTGKAGKRIPSHPGCRAQGRFQNAAWPGVRGNGMTSRMLPMPVA